MSAPLVIAHRTCPRQAAGNSLDGIRLAPTLGAMAVEVDVRVSRDGVPFLVHDRTLWGEARLPVPVELLGSAFVRRLRRRRGGAIPTLAEALRALPDGFTLAIDIKRGPGGRATAGEVRRAGAQHRVWLWSKRATALRRCARELPDVERALLRDARTRWGVRRFLADATRLQVHGISAHWAAVTPALAASARARGLRLFSMARRLDHQEAKLHLLDGLVTDWPAEAVGSIRAIQR